MATKNNISGASSSIKLLLILFSLFLFPWLSAPAQESTDNDIKLPPRIRFIRTYGGNDERNPPVVIKSSPYNIKSPVGESVVTIEFDVASDVPPILYARFVHCSADWEEDNNVFINNITYLRTSNINWESAPLSSNYYSYRGKLSVPNDQVKFSYSGNWKVLIYEIGREDEILAQARFFVLEPESECQLKLFSDFYEPEYKVAPSGLTMEAEVQAPQALLDNYLNTVVIYKNHRWFEPYVVSQNSSYEQKFESLYKYKFQTMIGGFSSAGKLFRIQGIPAENGYRVLDLSNLAQFPRSNTPVRLPFSDWRRTGSFNDPDDDGAMITDFITPSIDEYVYVEFVLDPDEWISNDDVFVSGSFNNWKPDYSWQMFYDSQNRLYTLRQWVRRGRHNYLYATGRYNEESGRVEKISYDEFEGNTVMTGQTYLAFVYYHAPDFGGYDALIGIGASNMFGPVVR
jgi:hypothetical protein